VVETALTKLKADLFHSIKFRRWMLLLGQPLRLHTIHCIRANASQISSALSLLSKTSSAMMFQLLSTMPSGSCFLALSKILFRAMGKMGPFGV
jgi:hypothetical protein